MCARFSPKNLQTGTVNGLRKKELHSVRQSKAIHSNLGVQSKTNCGNRNISVNKNNVTDTRAVPESVVAAAYWVL